MTGSGQGNVDGPVTSLARIFLSLALCAAFALIDDRGFGFTADALDIKFC